MTENQYKLIAPKLTISYNDVVSLLDDYKILDNNYRIAWFFAQITHESSDFKYKIENLNYSASALRTTFSKYFTTDEIAAEYARQPEKIANRVYANRMGNGDEASGDGYKYRGRGYIQLTGKNNYTSFSKSINLSISDTILYLETDEGALESALYYWDENNCNTYADINASTQLTKVINGGSNGLSDRIARYNKFIAYLEA